MVKEINNKEGNRKRKWRVVEKKVKTWRKRGTVLKEINNKVVNRNGKWRVVDKKGLKRESKQTDWKENKDDWLKWEWTKSTNEIKIKTNEL